MTDLVMRTFRAKPGAQAAVNHCLGRLASATIRQVAGTTVLIFRVENDPQQLVWLGDRGEERDFARLAPLSGAITEWLRSNLAVGAIGRRLRLIDEYHRRLPTPYQVWSVETRASEERGFDPRVDLRAARGDARLIGSALYRSVDDPTVLVLFLGLAWGVTPSGMGFSAARLGRASVSGTLSLILDMRRLACEASCAPFPEWIRHGVLRRAVAASVPSLLPEGDDFSEGRCPRESRRA